MASIIEGYEYDIFISYRQKDNKYDGWVTEFVENLKKELEATFKEEISVYFDINPHDGLLETHDVDASLKEKLKCLVFIPIISRTYCDPKSFAWENEFKAFVEHSSQDQFGLKVKLPNGNVTSRVLPVLINDLDNEDIKLCESVLGTVLRGVKFTYKEPGVNRPLTSGDEEKNNLNKTRYRNQINKVANALKEIILGLKTGSVVHVNGINLGEEIFDEVAVDERRLDHERPLKFTKTKLGRVIPWSLVGLMAISIFISWIFWHNSSNKPLSVLKSIYNLPQGEIIGIDERGSAIAFSPDETKLVYFSKKDNKSLLYLRNMDEFDADPIADTENGSAPFFSPDGKWVGFFADGYLKKVSIQGGAPQIICEARFGREGCWGQDNSIIFSNFYNRVLMRVLSSGGTPEQLTNSLVFFKEKTEQGDARPQILPGGKIILFTIRHNSEDMSIAAYSLETGERWTIIEPGSNARYIKTGHLIYAWKGDLLAVPFSLKKMEKIGQPTIILKGVMMDNGGLAHFSISDDGSLIYLPGNINESDNKLILVDHNGDFESLNIQVGQSPRFSPDGNEILYTRSQERSNVWIYGLERGTQRLFTDKNTEASWAIWTPDGKRIVFNSNLAGPELNLFWKMSDGTGQTERLTRSNYHQQPKSWGNDGRTLIYTEGYHPETGIDIWRIQIEGDTTPKPILNTIFNETHPSLSYDGHWLAYVSDESGQEEVFVCSFPDLRNKTQISTDGGMEPLWSPDGKELYYRDLSGNKLMAVSIITEPYLDPGKPRLLFQGIFIGSTGPWGRNYDITPDGKRFLMIEQGAMKSDATQINVIYNWSEELKRLETTDKMIR